LKDRMGSQRSNQCISELIKAALKEEKVVKIFALVPGESEYKGLEVDLLRGLEYPLIEQLNRPDWNRILSKYSRRKYEDERA